MEYIIFSILLLIVCASAYITGKTHGKLEAFNEIESYEPEVPVFSTLEDVVQFVVSTSTRRVH